MSIDHFRDGDRVRVTYEGTVKSRPWPIPGGGSTGINVSTSQDTHAVYPDHEAYTVEKIEPEYETATVYLDANNIFYLRGHGFWIFCADGTERGHNFPKRPLRKLVPEA
jgi:hypothetical protein